MYFESYDTHTSLDYSAFIDMLQNCLYFCSFYNSNVIILLDVRYQARTVVVLTAAFKACIQTNFGNHGHSGNFAN